ncbi:MAG: cyclic nucleotide-binding domain-containing protein [Nitrospinae bacterium]|nr:cyclic nucleotide-binding domain-containing protein [Nitrospinota bacterium]
MELVDFLKKECSLNAKNPIDHKILMGLPAFDEVFKEVELELLVKIAGQSGIALIEYKKFKEGQKLIEKGNYDQMLYWVVKGKAEVLKYIEKQDKPKVVYSFKEGECLGESVISGEERKSDIVAGKEGVEVVEIDFSIIDVCYELGTRLYQLIALTLCLKLNNSYVQEMNLINKASQKLKEMHHKLQALNKENQALKEKIKELES